MFTKQFPWGMLTMAHLVAALPLVRFWRISRDRLFLFFAGAFATLALNWVGLALIDPALELQHYVYLIRLFAFLLLIVGIVDKNRRSAG
jgi:type II secretory pathway component PulM